MLAASYDKALSLTLLDEIANPGHLSGEEEAIIKKANKALKRVIKRYNPADLQDWTENTLP